MVEMGVCKIVKQMEKSWFKMLVQDYNSWKMVVENIELNAFQTSTSNSMHFACSWK
jgi:hypothetical protein